MKSKEELNALKEEVETMKQKIAELTDEELTQVVAGIKVTVEDEESSWIRMILDFFFKIKK